MHGSMDGKIINALNIHLVMNINKVKICLQLGVEKDSYWSMNDCDSHRISYAIGLVMIFIDQLAPAQT